MRTTVDRPDDLHQVLVALTVADHVHHEVVRAWFLRMRHRFATTPITPGTLLRVLVRAGLPAADALEVLADVTGHRRHGFRPDDQPDDRAALRADVAEVPARPGEPEPGRG